MSSNRTIPMALFAVSLLIATLASSSFAANNGNTAAARPDWQPENTIQNMYENYMDWKAYTDVIDEEMVIHAGTDLFADLAGENFSITAELLAHYEDQAYPEGTCAQDFHYLFTEAMARYMHYYGAWYYNATTDTGEPIDTDHIAQEYNMFEEYYFGQDGIRSKCWNKLDT